MVASKKPTDKELLELGRKLQDFFDSGYLNKKQALGFSFMKGVVVGFGAFLGGTILIALLVWFLNLFSNPLAERIIDVLSTPN